MCIRLPYGLVTVFILNYYLVGIRMSNFVNKMAVLLEMAEVLATFHLSHFKSRFYCTNFIGQMQQNNIKETYKIVVLDCFFFVC